MAFKRISTIRPHDNAELLQIRVIKRWKPYGKRPELCYLFVDSHGDAIEAIVDLHHEAHFDSQITLHSCYTVTHYLSDTARPYMNVVPHTACIKLDYVGRMEKVSNIRGPENNRLKIMLQDQSGSFIEATLWEQIAFSFDREAALLKPQPMIIALTSMKVTDYRGLLQLGSTNATTVTVNPNIEELDDIIDRFDILNGHSSTYPTTSTSAISEEVDTNRLTLEELLQKTSDNNVKNKFTCLASIKEIETSQTWFYQSCTECKMRVIPKEERFACPDHGEIKSPRYMCCVNATITDETTSIPVVLFNDVMRIILGIDVTIWLKKKISQTQISYQHHCVLYKDDKKYSNFNCEDKTIKTLSPL